MELVVCKDSSELGKLAARNAARILIESIERKGSTSIILATGTSQLKTLTHLVRVRGINWKKVVMFHLDEYIGLLQNHPASFRNYLTEHFLRHVGQLKDVITCRKNRLFVFVYRS